MTTVEAVQEMGQRLQELRQKAGLSQPELAKAAGVPVGSLRNWEQGRRMLMLDVAYRLAEAMNITLDELAGKVFAKPTPKGKPAKPPAAAPEGRTSAATADESTTAKKAARGQGRKRKGKGES